jgi:hypothetical protein
MDAESKLPDPTASEVQQEVVGVTLYKIVMKRQIIAKLTISVCCSMQGY